MSLLTILSGMFAGLLAHDFRSVNETPPPTPPPQPQFDARALYDALVSANAMGGDGKVDPFKLYSTREASAADMERMFRPAKPPKGVVPDGFALDSINNPMDLWGYGGLGSITEGMFWLGFPYLAELAQRTEYRRIAETIAKDMTRRWFRLQATGRDDKTDKIKALEELMKFHKLQEKFTLLALLDGFFGRGHLYIDTGVTDDQDLLKLPLPADARLIRKGDLKGLRVIEPMWAYPHMFNANDPLKENFYLPQSWWVMGKEIHRTRLLPFVGREMPDMLKPAYSFAGLSLSQMAKPYVDNWLRTRQSISDLIHSFSTPVMMTNMGPILNAGASATLKMRAALFNYLRDNNNLMVLDKTTEDFKNVSAPLGGLDHLQAQSQEHMASAVGIPLVVLLGISPSGLNATSEGELQVWAQFIHAAQGSFFDAHLTSILNIMQLSLFGEIDPAITHAWEPLRELSEEEESTAEKTQADIDAVYINAGVLSPDEIRQRLSGEADSPYQGLDLDSPAPPPPQQEQDPMGGGGHDPLGGMGGGPGGPSGGSGGPPGAGGPGGAANLNSKPAGGAAGPVSSGPGKVGAAGGSAAAPNPNKGSRDEDPDDDQPISVLDPNTGHTRIATQDPNAEIHVHLGQNDHAHVKLGMDGIGVAFGQDAIDAFNPNQKRGQPENAGEFGPGGGAKGALAGKVGKTTTKTYVHAHEDETAPAAPGRQEPHLGGTPAHEGQRVGGHSVIHLHAGERMAQLSQPQGSAILGAGKNYVMGYGQHNYDMIAQKIAELDPEKRGSMAARALQVAKAWPQMVKHTIAKEKDEVVHTLGGIKALLTPGKSPTPEQWHSMRHVATTAIVLAGTVYMGLPAHAGAAEVAGHLGDELLKHVITEHALEVMVGAGLSALSMIAPGHAPEHKTPTLKQTQGYDAALPDDPESPENIKLMQQWFTALAESIKTITPEKAQELMQKNGTRGDTFDEDDDGADPQTNRYDGGAQDDFDPNEPRDESGRWGSPGGHIQWKLPPTPGTTPIPEGHIRLYHQTDEKNLGAIKHQGILMSKAEGIEGPRGIYADPKGFYGSTATTPTVEFHVPKEQWDGPFVRADRIDPTSIIGVHHPWHSLARSLEGNKNASQAILEGKRDHLLNDPTYGKAIRFIKHKYGGQVQPQAHDEFLEIEHPRGQPENAGQFAKKGEEVSGGPKAAVAAAPKAKKTAAPPTPASPATQAARPPIMGATFVSPSVASHLDLPQAIEGLHTTRQHVLERASRDIDFSLGIHSRDSQAIGAWSDGAENSIMTEVEGGTFEQLKVAAAMKAHIADQKAVLVFQESENGGAVLFRFPATGRIDKIHQDLLDDGVAFHTIVPTVQGPVVYVLDMDGSEETAHAVARAAERYGSTVAHHQGQAAFIQGNDTGSDREQRDSSRGVYEGVISASRVPRAKALWQRVHSTYGSTLDVSETEGEGISTRLPSEPQQRKSGINAHQTAELKIDWQSALTDEAKPWLRKATNLLTGRSQYTGKTDPYVGMPPGPPRETPKQAAERFITFAKGNILALYHAVPDAWRDRASHWYDGARVIADRWAGEYGYSPQQVAGVIASLSPRKNWFQNVSLAHRILTIMRDHQGTQFDDKSADAFRTLIASRKDAKRTEYQGVLDRMQKPDGSWKTLGELKDDSMAQAAWINMYDLAHGDATYHEVTPEGEITDTIATNQGDEDEPGTPGAPTVRTWATIDNIAKAVSILKDGRTENISRNTGNAHKVRNFYMNILYPNSQGGHITVDTHAIGAALLRPLGGDDEEVVAGLGRMLGSATGLGGTYPMIAEAYRRAAAELSNEGHTLLPRQVQSIVWEGMQGIFTPAQKRNARLRTAVDDVWRQHMRGQIDAAEARRQVLALGSPEAEGKAAGVPRDPKWYRPSA